MKRQDDWKKILLYLLKNQHTTSNVTKVRNETHIHPKHFTSHKRKMEKKGLIKIEIKGWKKGEKTQGRSQLLSITPKGRKWLINNLCSSLQKILGELSNSINQLTHETDVKKNFRKDLSGIPREDFELAKNCVKTMFEPFRELYRNIVVLQLWLQPNYHVLAGVAPWMQLLKSKPPTQELALKESKQIVESNYFLFGPNMEGFVPIPPLPPDDRWTMAYFQREWKFVESLSNHKGGPLPLPPLKRPPKNTS